MTSIGEIFHAKAQRTQRLQKAVTSLQPSQIVEKNNEIPLAKGYHAIRILFFERSGGDALQVHWKGPGFTEQNIPASVLFGK